MSVKHPGQWSNVLTEKHGGTLAALAFCRGIDWLRNVDDLPPDATDELMSDQHRPTQGWDIAGLVDE